MYHPVRWYWNEQCKENTIFTKQFFPGERNAFITYRPGN